MKGKLLICSAMPAEISFCGQFECLETLATGIGKVNAALTLTERILDGTSDPVSFVLNIGIAGSNVFNPGEIVNCHLDSTKGHDRFCTGRANWHYPF